MIVHRALDGGGADINAGAPARGGERADCSAPERPDEHHAAGFGGARRHGFAKARAMPLFVRQRLAQPRDEIRMALARLRQLRRIDRDGAMLASVVHAQDAGDETGWQLVFRLRRKIVERTIHLLIAVPNPKPPIEVFGVYLATQRTWIVTPGRNIYGHRRMATIREIYSSDL